MRLDHVGPDLVAITLRRRNLLCLLATLEVYPSDSDFRLYRRQDLESPVHAVHVEPDHITTPIALPDEWPQVRNAG